MPGRDGAIEEMADEFIQITCCRAQDGRASEGA